MPQFSLPRAAGPRLLLHADDFGMNSAVNAGIQRGFTHGLLTGTSLLANAPGFDEALSLWQTIDESRRAGQLPSRENRLCLGDDLSPFDVGVHLNLTQGRPLTGERYPGDLLDSQGCFPGTLRLFRQLTRHPHRYQGAIRGELLAQIARVVEAGFRPQHLNGHQYVELFPSVAELIPSLCQKFQIPTVRLARETGLWRSTRRPRWRPLAWGLALLKRRYADRFAQHLDRAGLAHTQAFYGTAHAGLVTREVLRQFLARPLPGVTVEIGLHPGTASTAIGPHTAADGWSDPLANLRSRELALLESSELVELLIARGTQLIRFSDLTAHFHRAVA